MINDVIEGAKDGKRSVIEELEKLVSEARTTRETLLFNTTNTIAVTREDAKIYWYEMFLEEIKSTMGE